MKCRLVDLNKRPSDTVPEGGRGPDMAVRRRLTRCGRKTKRRRRRYWKTYMTYMEDLGERLLTRLASKRHSKLQTGLFTIGIAGGQRDNAVTTTQPLATVGSLSHTLHRHRQRQRGQQMKRVHMQDKKSLYAQ